MLLIVVVKLFFYVLNVLRSSLSFVCFNNLENLLVKSIVSGIIDVYSGNIEELKKVYLEFDLFIFFGCEISGFSVGYEVGVLKCDREVVIGV